MRKPRKNAADLLAEIQGDANFRQREFEAEQKRLQREEEYARILKPLLRQLNELGYEGDSIQEIVRTGTPLVSDAVEILLSALPSISDARAKETVVRALGASNAPFSGRSLISCFEQTQDEGLKWAIVNTIAMVAPHSIDNWLISIHDTSWGETLRKLSAAQQRGFGTR